MLIYEKDNKLNINFENSVNESPDLQIGKSGDKTEVLIDGQPGGGSGGTSNLIIATFSEGDDDCKCDKTYSELKSASDSGAIILGFDKLNACLFGMRWATRFPSGGRIVGTEIYASDIPGTQNGYIETIKFTIKDDGTLTRKVDSYSLTKTE